MKRIVIDAPADPHFASVMNVAIVVSAVQAWLGKRYPEAVGMEGAANIELIGRPSYGWHILVRDQRIRFMWDLAPAPVCVIRASERTLSELLVAGNCTMALLTGAVTVQGEALLTPLFVSIFSRFRRLANSSNSFARGLARLISCGGPKSRSEFISPAAPASGTARAPGQSVGEGLAPDDPIGPGETLQ